VDHLASKTINRHTLKITKMKNKTKIIPDITQAQPFNTIVACQQCTNTKAVTIYPALGANFFECQQCLKVNQVAVTPEMEAIHD
jgi:transcription elongation factor Elf1